MPIGNWNLQWLNHNSQRSYPLTERASKLDVTGSFTVPDSFIVALYFPVSAALDVKLEKFYIKTILNAPIGYAIGIGYETDTGETILVGSANITKATHTPNNAYAVSGINDFADSVGHIVIGELAEIDELPAGLYEFAPAATTLEADAIRPMIRGVAAIKVTNGIETSARLYGDVELVAGSNMRLSYNLGSNGNHRITFDAISGENLNTPCDCDINPTGECIRCINGVCSDDGTFTLVGNDCINVGTQANALVLSDVCALPCCGCAELDAIKTQVDRFGDGVNTLKNFVTRLSSEVTQMSFVVLGSRLGDAGCDSCG